MKKEYRIHIELKNYDYQDKFIYVFSDELKEQICNWYIKNTFYLIESEIIESIDIYYKMDGLFYVFISWDENIHGENLPTCIENLYNINRMNLQTIKVGDLNYYVEPSLIGTY